MDRDGARPVSAARRSALQSLSSALKSRGPCFRWGPVDDAPTNRRSQRRRRLADPPTVEVRFCGPTVCLGAIRNEHLQGLGVVFYGTDAARAWEHRRCCLGATVALGLAGPRAVEGTLPVRLIHLTRPVDGHLPCNAGVSLERERLGPDDVERLLDLWTRLQKA